MATQFLHILLTWTKCLFDCDKDLRRRTHGRNGRPQRERGCLGNVFEYHSSNSSSSWSGCDQNLRFVKNHFWSSLKKLFKGTEKLIKNQTEIIGLSMIDYEEYKWSTTRLLRDKIYQISNAETYVFSDSVLCLGGRKENLNGKRFESY